MRPRRSSATFLRRCRRAVRVERPERVQPLLSRKRGVTAREPLQHEGRGAEEVLVALVAHRERTQRKCISFPRDFLTSDRVRYFFLPGMGAFVCIGTKGVAGATGPFCCLGFFASRLLRWWPLGIRVLLRKTRAVLAYARCREATSHGSGWMAWTVVQLIALSPSSRNALCDGAQTWDDQSRAAPVPAASFQSSFPSHKAHAVRVAREGNEPVGVRRAVSVAP